ncbi:MAG: hypothetical protein DME87_01570 [Verrucomicrobia bacterium]|nr:MAG: hypothetical protein DME87_01570 [Verrucomicrobiota bacterium]
MKMRILTLLILSFAPVVLADDFKTIEGKEYKNVKVSRVEPDGIVLITKAGISKVYFTELPKAVQERFNYDPEKAPAYSAEQNAALEQLRNQQQEAMIRRAETTEKTNKYVGEQAQASAARQSQQEKVQRLQARYDELQKQERDLIRRIQEAERLPRYLTGQSGNKHYSYLNPAWQYVPDWEENLSDVRHEKDQVRKQLEQAQR